MLLCLAVIGLNSTAVIGAAFRSVSLYGTLQNGSPVVVFFDHWHPGLWDFNSIILVDAVKVKLSVNCLFYLGKLI